MSVLVEKIDPLTDVRWDGWLQRFPEANCFHSSAWLRAVSSAYDHEAHGWVLKDGEEVRGMAPWVVADSRWLGKRAASVAFADLAPPLVDVQGTFALLHREVLEHGRSSGWKRIEWRGACNLGADIAPSTTYWQHVLDLSGGKQAVAGRLSDATRRNIQKARKSGLQVELSQAHSAVLQYYELHCATRRRLGTPPQPLRFFESIWTHVIAQGLGFVALVRSESVPVAGVVVLRNARRAVYKFGASDMRHQAQRPSNLAMWAAIQHCIELGVQDFHFGRTSLHQDGLRRFKAGWGARESRLDYYCIDMKSGRSLHRPDRMDGWPAAVIRRMPIGAVRTVGELLYGHLV